MPQSTTGGQGARVSELAVAQPVSQSIAISTAAGGGVEHLAVDGIVSLSGVKPFGVTCPLVAPAHSESPWGLIVVGLPASSDLVLVAL